MLRMIPCIFSWPLILLFREIDYYGITFDHLVPVDESEPDVLKINIIEMETGFGPFVAGAAYANEHLSITLNQGDYVGKKVFAVPRCC